MECDTVRRREGVTVRSTPVPIPDRISGFRSTVINGLIDFCESLRPIKSATVWPEWRPDGVAQHAQPRDGGAAGTFPGNAWTPDGNRYTGLTDSTKPWLRYNKATGAITETDVEPSYPWGQNDVWRRKQDFAGDVYF